MAEIQQHLQDLLDISAQQQQVLASAAPAELDALFTRRGELFPLFVQKLGIVHQYLDDHAAFATDPRTQGAIAEINQTVSQVMRSDRVVEQLLALRMEQMQGRLAEQYQTQQGVRNYQSVEAATSVIARIFPGHSRYFDDKG